jgi:hypothetical protein
VTLSAYADWLFAARCGYQRVSELSRRAALHPGYEIDFARRIATIDCAETPELIARPAGKAMSDEEMKAELDRLRNENAALKKGASSGLRMKVSEKGAVSIYGMGRFPVTLYKEQWLKLLAMSDEIRAFIAANEAQLKAKD